MYSWHAKHSTACNVFALVCIASPLALALWHGWSAFFTVFLMMFGGPLAYLLWEKMNPPQQPPTIPPVRTFEHHKHQRRNKPGAD